MPSRPLQVGKFVGQRKNIEPLLRQQDGARARGEPAGHCLITGPSGTGKSLLAQMLAERGKTELLKFVGGVEVEEVVEGLTGLKPCDVALLDEAHNLSEEVQELLFEVMDSSKIPAKYAPGTAGGKAKKGVKVAPITLVFATDRPGKLLNALHKRIVNRVHFDPYTSEEMEEIVGLVASRLRVLLSPRGARRLARVCNGLPRRAEQYVSQLRYHYSDSEKRELRLGDVDGFLTAWGMDETGLGKQERCYVRFLARNRSASLETLASVLGLDAEFVKSQVEQPLRYRGLIRIESRGRVLTAAGEKIAVRLHSAAKARRQEG